MKLKRRKVNPNYKEVKEEEFDWSIVGTRRRERPLTPSEAFKK
jgi:hypothetical protein